MVRKREKEMRIDIHTLTDLEIEHQVARAAADTLTNVAKPDEPVELAYDSEKEETPLTPSSNASLVIFNDNQMNEFTLPPARTNPKLLQQILTLTLKDKTTN